MSDAHTAAGSGRSRRVDAVRHATKRGLDVVSAALALVVLSPLFALIALLVVLDSPGPVFYRAERVGRRGRPMRMLKFRKMCLDASGGALTVADDERLTRVGALLLRTKLDELPQLWHVLRGEMSIVGPRPESPGYVARFRSDYDVILAVRPGLTGYTQLAFAREGWILDPQDPHGHYVNGLLPQKVALDRLYATRLGTRRDLRIVLATVATLVFKVPVAVDRSTGALRWRRRTEGALDGLALRLSRWTSRFAAPPPGSSTGVGVERESQLAAPAPMEPLIATSDSGDGNDRRR
jgi:lipopolysaccharide/colanic/teichoic acid biosynthesis glycosyltransferase